MVHVCVEVRSFYVSPVRQRNRRGAVYIEIEICFNTVICILYIYIF